MEILASLVSSTVELGKCFKKHFNYLGCIRTNIRDLSDAVRDVEDARVGLQSRVDAATRNLEQILPAVETWLQRAEDTQAIKLQIIDPAIPVIWHLKSRYSRSKKAKKGAESMGKLRDSCNFDLVSTPPPPAAMGQIPLPSGAHEFESRKQTEEDIIMAMREEEMKVIGVCGMGGVGKTTMAKQIMKRAREKEDLFDEVVMVAVGQQGDMLKIQEEIADWLGLELKEKALVPRANRLRDRLIMSGKRKLIIIDDIWERIDLGSLGIPYESGLCKVFFTSRDESVLDAHKTFTVNELNEEETWFMFKENAGACVEDSELFPIAREVAEECDGLPLAIVIIARALKGVRSKLIWDDALKQLKRGNPTNIRGVIKDVYNHIKLSYDFLESENAKSLLLLCSCFPEDYDISLEEDLMCCSFGLGMFDDTNNLEETRGRIATLIKTLQSRFLILEGRDEHHVKVHDVIRDVTNFIALEKKHAILQFSSMDYWSTRNPPNDICTMLLVVPKEEIIERLMELSFPTLQLLLISGSRFELSDGFFNGMRELKVLNMESSSFATTPQSMQLLKKLTTLNLSFCTSLKTLSAVGELSSLEILICRGCDSITDLPTEIGKLKRLMLLDVSDCRNLKTIMPGVISNLVQLEELKMLSSFKGWESDEKGKVKSNVSLTELVSLVKLKCLKIEIEDWSLAAKELQLSSNIVKYKIFVGKRTVFRHPGNALTLNFPMEENSLSLGNWIQAFARSAEFLWLKGGAFGSDENHMNASSSANHHSVHLFCNPKHQDIVTFGCMKDLTITYNNNINYLWGHHIPHVNFFSGLEKLEIYSCADIHNLFSYSIAGTLVNLKTLTIRECSKMVYVIADDINTTTETYEANPEIMFHKLVNVLLWKLPRLQSFCEGKRDLQFPSLEFVNIVLCPRMEGFTMGLLSTPKMKKFNPASTTPLPAAMVPMAQHSEAYEFASRKKIEDDIIKAMRDGEVKFIGVFGMGGVGKTMMAKRIMEKTKEKEDIFDKVVMVAAGQQADMLKIQDDIAECLDLELNVKTLAPRADQLRDRLMGGKRTLIVIDNISERIDLESLGIPCEIGLCKVIFTSRSMGVLNQMDVNKIFTVGKLNEEEAWFMFKENAGACVDDSRLFSIAREVAKECRGLPLALAVVASALKGMLSETLWKDGLKRLRSPIDILDFYDVPIKLSCDILENEHAKSLLLLCSFFPEDYDISVQNDLYSNFGLRLLDEINNLEETRNRIAMVIEMLKSRFLILDGKDEYHVKIHDVVRAVINYIHCRTIRAKTGYFPS